MLVEALLAPVSIGGGLSLVKHQKLLSFDYRAINPVIVNRTQHLCGSFVPFDHPILSSTKGSEGGAIVVWAEDDEGIIGMVGVVKLVS